MMSALLVAGIVAILAGLGAIAYGIPVKEFSFGNTMVLAGTIAVCTGLLLFGLAALLSELRQLSHRLRLKLSTDANPKPLELPASEQDGRDDVQPAAAPVEDNWREAAARGRGGRLPERPVIPPAIPEPEPEPEPVAAEPKPRRNLFVEAASRRERERAEKRSPGPLVPDFRRPPPDEPLDLLPDELPGEPSAPSLEETWPRPERIRAPDPTLPPLPRRPARAAPAFVDPPAPPPRAPEPPTVTVIRSGVVDGMAYSLYSDGSIEAQMPEGMMRFASIDELRTHLDERG